MIMRSKIQLSKTYPEDEGSLVFYSVSKWLDCRFTEEFILFLTYLSFFFKGDIWVVSHNGKERSRSKLSSSEEVMCSSFMRESFESDCLFNKLIDKIKLRFNCCYCGYPVCFEIHEDLKLLEVWKKPHLWIPFGYDFFISLPLKTFQHSVCKEERLVYIADVRFEIILCFNIEKKELYPSISKHDDFFFNHFPARTPQKVLCLKTWALRGLLKNRYVDFCKLAKKFPYKCLEPFKSVGECLNALSKMPLAEYSFLHHLQQVMRPL